MTDALRDQNRVTVLLGVSSADGVTPIPLKINPVTGRILAEVAAGGESNTASNTGSAGIGIFKQKTGVNLEFYKINSTNALLTIALDGTDKVDLTINEASIDHTAIANIGTNSHAAIDTHIADATIHFTEASIDHTAIANIGTNSHATIDSHISDATIHFTEASIDHTAIANIGTNSHAAIDTHITAANPHSGSQPLDATLTSLATLGTAADKLAYTTGVDTWAETVFTAFGRSLVDDANAVTARTTLGLGSIATQAANNVAITGGSVTGITDIVVADGGTGRGTATAYAVLCGGTTATGSHRSIASVGTDGQVLTSNGAAALPTFQDTAGGGFTSAARANRQATQTITTNTETKVQLNVESYDIDGEFDSTTNYRFTATDAGRYQVNANVHWATAVDETSMQAIIKINGSTYASYGAINASGIAGQDVGISDILNLSADDYVELFCRQNSGSDKNVIGQGTGGAATFMSIARIQ